MVISTNRVRALQISRRLIGLLATVVLHKQAAVVFAAATSALDNQTEAAVMESIEGLQSDFTRFIFSHRMIMLRSGDQIVDLHQCGIRRVGIYQEIIVDLAPAGLGKLPVV